MSLAAINYTRAVRYANHKEEVDKISRRSSQHFQRMQDEAKQARLRAAQREREREQRERERERQRRQQQAYAREQAAALFARHDVNANGVLGRDALCGLLREALPQIGVEPPDVAAVAVLLRRCEMEEGVTREDAESGGVGVTLAGIPAVLLKYKEYLREQTVLDEAFAKYNVDGEGVMGFQGLLAMLRELAPDQRPDAADARFVLRHCGDRDLAATPPEEVRIGPRQLRALLPALARWLRRGAEAKGTAPGEGAGGQVIVMQGVPPRPAASSGTIAPAPAPPRAPAPPPARSSVMCVVQ
eukprot:Transcript_29021.p1 GENE.Transcript_29021~~Transcript_29021.p1  ORF type:complete len:300 (-),score=81.42 Transcript_29021:515-1414(-)